MKQLLPLISLLSLTFVAWNQQQSNVDLSKINVPNTFAVEDRYIYVKPSQMAFEGAMNRPEASEDSRYLAFFGDPTANRDVPYLPDESGQLANFGPNQGLYIYDIQQRHLLLISKFPAPRYRIENVSWLERSNILYCSVSDGKVNTKYIFDSATKRIVTLPQSPPELDTKYAFPRYVSNANSLVYITSDPENDQRSNLYILNLQTNQWRKLFVNVKSYFIESNGKQLLVHEYNPETQMSYQFQINLNTGQLIRLPDEKLTFEALTHLIDVSYTGPEIAISDGGSTFGSLFGDEEEGKPKAPRTQPVFLTKTGLHGGITNDQKTAWYTDRSGLHTCELVTLTPGQFEALAIESIKQQAMSQAKQVGIGLSIYTSDYDDLLPPANNWSETVSPYVRNNQLFTGFTYLMNGQNITDIKDPANTPMGQVDTPFGSAIVNVDGSVIWKDRPKPTLEQNLSELRN